MKIFSSIRGQGSLNAQFLFDIAKLLISVAVVLFSMYVISSIIIFFWPAPDVNLMAVGSIVNTLDNGVKLLNSPSANAVILPVVVQFTREKLEANVQIKSGGTYNPASQATALSEILPKMCLFDVSNSPLPEEIGCVDISVSKKLYVKYFDKDIQFALKSEVQHPLAKYIGIRKESDGYEIFLLHTDADVQQWSAQYLASQAPPVVVVNVEPVSGTIVEIVRSWAGDVSYKFENNLWSSDMTPSHDPKKYSHEEFRRLLASELAANSATTITLQIPSQNTVQGIVTLFEFQREIDASVAAAKVTGIKP